MTLSASTGGVKFRMHNEMRAAELYVDRAAEVRAPCADRGRAQCTERVGVRMPEHVVTPAGDESEARMDGLQHRRRRRGTAPMMRHLEDVRAHLPVGQHPLG